MTKGIKFATNLNQMLKAMDEEQKREATPAIKDKVRNQLRTLCMLWGFVTPKPSSTETINILKIAVEVLGLEEVRKIHGLKHIDKGLVEGAGIGG